MLDDFENKRLQYEPVMLFSEIEAIYKVRFGLPDLVQLISCEEPQWEEILCATLKISKVLNAYSFDQGYYFILFAYF